MVYFCLCRKKILFTFVSTVSKLLKKTSFIFSYARGICYNKYILHCHSVIFFYKVFRENCYYGRFSNFFYSDQPVAQFNRFHQNVMAFCKFSLDSLLDGLTKKMQKWFKSNLILNFKKIDEYVFVTISFKLIYFQNLLNDQRSLQHLICINICLK